MWARITIYHICLIPLYCVVISAPTAFALDIGVTYDKTCEILEDQIDNCSRHDLHSTTPFAILTPQAAQDYSTLSEHDKTTTNHHIDTRRINCIKDQECSLFTNIYPTTMWWQPSARLSEHLDTNIIISKSLAIDWQERSAKTEEKKWNGAIEKSNQSITTLQKELDELLLEQIQLDIDLQSINAEYSTLSQTIASTKAEIQTIPSLEHQDRSINAKLNAEYAWAEFYSREPDVESLIAEQESIRLEIKRIKNLDIKLIETQLLHEDEFRTGVEDKLHSNHSRQDTIRAEIKTLQADIAWYSWHLSSISHIDRVHDTYTVRWNIVDIWWNSDCSTIKYATQGDMSEFGRVMLFIYTGCYDYRILEPTFDLELLHSWNATPFTHKNSLEYQRLLDIEKRAADCITLCLGN